MMGHAQWGITTILLMVVPRGTMGWMKLSELDLLKNFYNSTDGAQWLVNTNWDMAASSQCGWADQSVQFPWPYEAPAVEAPQGPACVYKDPCGFYTKWNGVGCIDPCYYPTDGDNCAMGRVTMLNLPSNSLGGTIPVEFLNELRNISILDLSFNSLSGTIPTQVGKLRNLAHLQLQNNNLNGPIPTEIAQIGNALGDEGLHTFDVSHNNLTGTIPSEIGYLDSLLRLDISNNEHFGYPPDPINNLAMNPPIPSELGLLTKLQLLNLDSDSFQGFLPSELFDMQSLRQLYLRGSQWGLLSGNPTANQLSGTIPSQIGKMHNLLTTNIAYNLFSGTLPAQMAGMWQLNHWEAQENLFTGPMPDIFGHMSNLETWDMWGNTLTGELAPTVMNLTNLKYLYVQYPQLTGIRRWDCGSRIPGRGSPHTPLNVPSRETGQKFNWVIVADEYFNYNHNSLCSEDIMNDVAFSFDVLTQDV